MKHSTFKKKLKKVIKKIGNNCDIQDKLIADLDKYLKRLYTEIKAMQRISSGDQREIDRLVKKNTR